MFCKCSTLHFHPHGFLRLQLLTQHHIKCKLVCIFYDFYFSARFRLTWAWNFWNDTHIPCRWDVRNKIFTWNVYNVMVNVFMNYKKHHGLMRDEQIHIRGDRNDLKRYNSKRKKWRNETYEWELGATDVASEIHPPKGSKKKSKRSHGDEFITSNAKIRNVISTGVWKGLRRLCPVYKVICISYVLALHLIWTWSTWECSILLM